MSTEYYSCNKKCVSLKNLGLFTLDVRVVLFLWKVGWIVRVLQVLGSLSWKPPRVEDPQFKCSKKPLKHWRFKYKNIKNKMGTSSSSSKFTKNGLRFFKKKIIKDFVISQII